MREADVEAHWRTCNGKRHCPQTGKGERLPVNIKHTPEQPFLQLWSQGRAHWQGWSGGLLHAVPPAPPLSACRVQMTGQPRTGATLSGQLPPLHCGGRQALRHVPPHALQSYKVLRFRHGPGAQRQLGSSIAYEFTHASGSDLQMPQDLACCSMSPRAN